MELGNTKMKNKSLSNMLIYDPILQTSCALFRNPNEENESFVTNMTLKKGIFMVQGIHHLFLYLRLN